jgi:prevent-host-death family protein
MVLRMSLSKFRTCIAEVVRNADHGEPTVLTDYGRDVAAIVPVAMFQPPENREKKSPSSEPEKRKSRVS